MADKKKGSFESVKGYKQLKFEQLDDVMVRLKLLADQANRQCSRTSISKGSSKYIAGVGYGFAASMKVISEALAEAQLGENWRKIDNLKILRPETVFTQTAIEHWEKARAEKVV